MSSGNSERLTEEQEELLKSLEEEFKDRYTEREEGYSATLKEQPQLPPIVVNWRDFGRRDRGGNRYIRGQDRRRHRFSDGFSYYSRNNDRYRNRHSNQNRWH